MCSIPTGGAQYTSAEFVAALAARNLLGSMGRTGICWDNAAAESFFASLKKELVHRTVFPTQAKARTAIAEYIEVFYNRQRLHSSLGYRTATGPPRKRRPTTTRSSKPPKSAGQHSRKSSRPVRKSVATPMSTRRRRGVGGRGRAPAAGAHGQRARAWGRGPEQLVL